MEMKNIPFGTTNWAKIVPTEHKGETGMAIWRTQHLTLSACGWKNTTMWKHALTFMIVYLIITACTNTSTGTPSLVSFFPQAINTPTVYLEALFTGELILDNGCLRVKDTDGNSVLLIWHPGFSTRMDQGNVQIVDSTGQVAASVGDFVAVGGGFDSNPTWIGLAEPLPNDCLGPYWLVGEAINKIDRP